LGLAVFDLTGVHKEQVKCTKVGTLWPAHGRSVAGFCVEGRKAWAPPIIASRKCGCAWHAISAFRKLGRENIPMALSAGR
jgi:hypothetical protein